MTTESFADANITDHAASQMTRRRISLVLVHDVLRNPQQVLDVRPGRVVLQSRVMIDEKSQLVRVFVDTGQIPFRVITVYRTSKIDKYWSQS